MLNASDSVRANVTALIRPENRQPPEADRSGPEEEGKDPGHVVHVGVGHVLAAREKVCGELRKRDEREARREHEQTAQRNGQENDVEDVVAVRHLRDDREWIRHSSTKNPGRRAADLLVVPVEQAVATEERGHDDGQGDCRPDEPGAGDDRPCATPTARECVPEAERRDRERHELARPRDKHRTHRERQQAVGVEEPDAEEQERNRHGHGVERVERDPRGPRVREIRQREQAADPRRTAVPPREPVHGQRPDATATT